MGFIIFIPKLLKSILFYSPVSNDEIKSLNPKDTIDRDIAIDVNVVRTIKLAGLSQRYHYSALYEKK